MPAPHKYVDPVAGPGAKRFAERLSELVASTGMSVGLLAETVGLARSSLYAVLSGRRVPNYDFMADLLSIVERESRWPEKKLGRAVRRVEAQHARLYVKLPKRRRPTKPVRVGVLPEQVALAEGFSALLHGLTQKGVDINRLTWSAPGWLRRYANGESIPGGWALIDLGAELRAQGINVSAEIDALMLLADTARTARARERRWARVLAGGSP